MKQETFDLILGLGVLLLGLGLLLFTFANALALAANPGSFIANQLPAQQQGQGPTASFTWSSSGFNLTVQDTSTPGTGPIASWQWDFGDSSSPVSMQNPGVHAYSGPGSYYVTLTVTGSGGQTRTTFAPVLLVPGETRSGRSIGDVTSQFSLPNFNLENLVVPIGIGLLTVGLYLAMAVIGGLIMKAGWNLIRPRPETIHIRLKPQHLLQMIEADSAQSPPATLPVPAVPPPPPPQS